MLRQAPQRKRPLSLLAKALRDAYPSSASGSRSWLGFACQRTQPSIERFHERVSGHLKSAIHAKNSTAHRLQYSIIRSLAPALQNARWVCLIYCAIDHVDVAL